MSRRDSGVDAWKRPVGAVMCAVILLAAAACGRDTSSTAGAHGGTKTEQFLSASAGRGGSAVAAPPGVSGSYNATFGSFILCRSRPGPAPVISAVTLHAGHVGTTRVKLYIRQLTPRFVKTHRDLKPQSLIPVAFGLGSAPHFREPYAGVTAPGKYLPNGGYKVSETCAQAEQANYDLNLGKAPRTKFGELMLVVTSKETGSVIRSFDITYHAGDRSYALPVRWSLTNCGTVVVSDC